MKKILLFLPLIILISGCALLESAAFWRFTVGTLIRSAYDNGGAESVEYHINALTHNGTITPEQAEKIKAAAQKGYDKLIDALLETNTKNIKLNTPSS